MTMLSDGMLLGAGGAATIAFVASATGVSSTTTLSINRPAATSAGDLLIAIVWGQSMASCSLAGWTLAASDFSGLQTYAILTRTADGSEGASFAFSTNAVSKNGAVLQYRGGTGAVNVIGASTEASSATATAASVTATQAGVVVASFFLINSTTISSAPAGMTQRAFNNASMSAAIYDAASPAGATGARTLTWNASQFNAGIALQIY